MGWLWAAYKAGSFKIPEGLDQQTFAAEIQKRLGTFENFIVEDDSRKFKGGRGPVAQVQQYKFSRHSATSDIDVQRFR